MIFLIFTSKKIMKNNKNSHSLTQVVLNLDRNYIIQDLQMIICKFYNLNNLIA